METKILFPTDFSENSQNAFQHVVEIASKFRAKVILVYVYESLEDTTAEDLGFLDGNPYLEKMEEQQVSNARKKMDDLKAILEQHECQVDIFIEKGKPNTTILDICEQQNCDFIVLGKRGLGKIKSFLYGSVSNYVLHHATCPVYVVQ